MSIEEGFNKAVNNLKSVNIENHAPVLWWT